MRFRVRSPRGLALTLCLLVALPSAVTSAATPERPQGTELLDAAGDLLAGATNTLSDLGDAVTATADGVVAASLAPCGGSGSLTTGSDGRLTILLLGSDYRRSPYIGERMDVILVATRKSNGSIAVASIPRDTVFFPRKGGSTSGTSRVNTLYYRYKRTGKFGPAAVDCAALNQFKADVATALATEIDYYAMVRMVPFVALVNQVDDVPVDVPGPIIDPYYGHHGIYFPDENGYRLKGNDKCFAKPDRCRSGLAYVRSRHGTQAGGSNNDFKRAYRQHDFIFAATQRVRARGTGSALSLLLNGIQGKVYTNVPKTYSVAVQIYNLLGGISMASKDRVVFGPTRWAYSNSQTPDYTFRLRLNDVRGWINAHFGS